jgi:hypothetical protein
MPAQHLLPNPRERIRSLARNKIVSKRQLRDEAIVPTVRAVGFRDLDELVSVAGTPLIVPDDESPIEGTNGHAPAERVIS